jgi:hypothetical protein
VYMYFLKRSTKIPLCFKIPAPKYRGFPCIHIEVRNQSRKYRSYSTWPTASTVEDGLALGSERIFSPLDSGSREKKSECTISFLAYQIVHFLICVFLPAS